MLYAVHKGNESLVLDAKCLNNMPTLKVCCSPHYYCKLTENCPKVTSMSLFYLFFQKVSVNLIQSVIFVHRASLHN